MSDFAKKLRKFSRVTTSAVALEPDEGMIDSCSRAFGTVFVFSVTPPTVKMKNLVYREVVENIESIPEVGVIFSSIDGLIHLSAFQSVFQHHKPALVIKTGEVINNKIARWLLDYMHYEVALAAKNWQLWKAKQ
jgi:hypothetical protein